MHRSSAGAQVGRLAFGKLLLCLDHLVPCCVAPHMSVLKGIRGSFGPLDIAPDMDRMHGLLLFMDENVCLSLEQQQCKKA